MSNTDTVLYYSALYFTPYFPSPLMTHNIHSLTHSLPISALFAFVELSKLYIPTRIGMKKRKQQRYSVLLISLFSLFFSVHSVLLDNELSYLTSNSRLSFFRGFFLKINSTSYNLLH